MTNHSQKLYWTADSPFSRIVLWALAESGSLGGMNLVHLNWKELHSDRSAEILSEERTVPFLISGDLRTADSLRILAVLFPDSFTQWLTEADGALYRCAEGQLGRIMYALYDGSTNEKTRGLWQSALASMSLLTAHADRTQKQTGVSWGQIAAHTFVHFCLHFRAEWKQDLSAETLRALALLERSASFHQLRTLAESHSCRVPCGGFSDSISF
jgi:hypothetical protein